MKWWNICIGYIILGILGRGEIDRAYGASSQTITFGTWRTQIDLQDMNYLNESDGAWLLPLGEKTLAFYQKRQGTAAFLSLFHDDHEQILWKTDEIDTLHSIWTPSPILATALLNANEIPDIFLSYSLDCGNSNRSECWKQMLTFVFDEDASIRVSLPLSEVQKSFTFPQKGEEEFFTDINGEQAFRRQSILMLLPTSTHG